VLEHLVEASGWSDKIERTLRLFGARLEQIGRAVPMMAAALSTYWAGLQQIVIVGSEGRADLERAVGSRYRPFSIALALEHNQDALAKIAPWIGAMKSIDDKATAFVCRNFACERPVTSAEALIQGLGSGISG
jgi:uncharacterized protein